MLSVIIPAYNEEKCIKRAYEAIHTLLDENGIEGEFIFVDDGSKDKTYEKLCAIADKNSSVRYISFSKNFGKEAAIYAGLSHSEGDYVAILDADLQDPPSLLPQMLTIAKVQLKTSP